MGFKEQSSQGGGGNYVKIKHGGLVMESKTPKEGYIPITVRNPSTDTDVTKFILKYPALDGKIVALKWYDKQTDFGRFMGLMMKLRDEENEIFYVDLPFGKRQYDTFVKVMENIDYSDFVELNAFPDKEDPRKTAFIIKQHGQGVKWKYTKKDMKDCPPPKAKKMGGWDFTDTNEWLFERLTEVVIPQVTEMYPDEVMKDKELDPEAEETTEETEEDTLVANPTKKTATPASKGTVKKTPAPDKDGLVNGKDPVLGF